MGVRVSRTLYDAYITCQESHYPGVLDNLGSEHVYLSSCYLQESLSDFPWMCDKFASKKAFCLCQRLL